MKILFFRSVWGMDDCPTFEAKFKKIKAAGFDGVELDVPLDLETCLQARQSLDDTGLAVVAQQWRTSGKTVAEHIASFEQQYERALVLKPLYLNSHTGCDHFTVEQNLEIFDHANGLAKKHGLEVYHETHRGRALFSAPATMQFLAARPELKLVADFSHWCCVHESLLADQAERVERATRSACAIHARVGHAEGPQIPDPRDELWRPNLEVHLAWWKKIVEHRRAEGGAALPICPEFGPAPYMTLLPHSHQPIADLWDINCWMRDWLKSRLMVPLLLLALVIALFSSSASASEFAFGADLSFLKQAEDHGMVFKDGTNALPGLQLFRNHGYNWIRLRIFVGPVSNNLPNDLAYTLAEAKDAKRLGYKFLLDFHYANSWADPGKQPTPETWMNLSRRDRVKKVFEYSRDTIGSFRDAGVLPDMVQVGNEVTHGMLWPDGKLPDHWKNFTDYLRAGINGVLAGCGTNSHPKIMIHIDQGGNMAKTKYFFDNLNHYDIPYDVIGFSYYPWWHGTLMDLRENLAFAAKTYHKDVIVVETAYNWRPARETADRVGPFPETPEGQREFLDEVTRIVLAVPDERGKGIFWWEPAVGHRGSLVSRSFFDDGGNALPVINVFDKYTRPVARKNDQ